MQSVTSKVKPVPQGYNSVSPYLIVNGASGLIDFLKNTFNAEQRDMVKTPDGRISHAEMKIGDSIIMLSDPTPEWAPTSSQLYVYIDNVDTVYQRALKAGATSVREPKNQFYGDRSATVKDQYGNYWGIATHIEDVPPDEMQRRIKEAYSNQ